MNGPSSSDNRSQNQKLAFVDKHFEAVDGFVYLGSLVNSDIGE